MASGPERPPYLAVGLVSGAAVGLEVLLMRLLTLVHGQQFAAMIISLALLGIGAAGVFLALAGPRLVRRAGPVLTACAALFGICAPGSFALAHLIPFNPLEALWDPAQWGHLFAVYLLLSVPFFFSGTFVGLALSRYGGRARAVYRADLAGAGLGAAGVLAVLWVLRPEEALRAVAVAGFAAASSCAPGRVGRGRIVGLALALGGLAVWLLFPREAVRPNLSAYKALSQTLRVAGARVVGEDSSPCGLVTLAESPLLPFRYAPGLDPACPAPVPPQTGVFLDGDFVAAIPADPLGPENIAFLDCLPTALAWKLRPGPRVLVLRAGTGLGLLEAVGHGSLSVEAVEANPRLPVPLADSPRGSGRDPVPVRLHRDGMRPFLARATSRYDLIHFRLPASGGQALAARGASEHFDTTVEAVQALLSRLSPDGLAMLDLWPANPPMEAFKLTATVQEALRRLGTAEAGRRLLVLRGVNLLVFLVKNGDFTAAEGETVAAFLAGRTMSLAWTPPGFAPASGSGKGLRDGPLGEGMRAILGPDRDGFLRGYKFHIAPATDAAPFFSRFFRPGSLPELWALRGRGGAPLLQWGYLSLAAVAVSAAAAGGLLLLAPLVLAGRAGLTPGKRWRVLAYFLALGLAFLFVEMTCYQLLGLTLGSTAWQAGVALGAFLLFAGLGAGASDRLSPDVSLPAAALCGAALPVLLLLGLPWLAGLPQWARAVCAALGLAPAAVFLGMPFPLGIARLNAVAPELIPWAYGVNAFASVLSPPLAALLAMHAGLPWVGAAAGILYLLAWRILRSL